MKDPINSAIAFFAAIIFLAALSIVPIFMFWWPLLAYR